MTPLFEGRSESKIEDCFDALIKSTVLNGKTFVPDNNFNRETDYGKADFAYKVVKPKADGMNFDGFKPILDRLIMVLDEHARKYLFAASI